MLSVLRYLVVIGAILVLSRVDAWADKAMKLDLGSGYRCEYVNSKFLIKYQSSKSAVSYASSKTKLKAQIKTIRRTRGLNSKQRARKIARINKTIDKMWECITGTYIDKLINQPPPLSEVPVSPPTTIPVGTPSPISTPTPIPPTPTPEPRTDTITRSGVTWKFDHPYRFGTFANGDYWVVPDQSGGTVKITSITPQASAGRHGWQVNPANFATQPFDDRALLYTPSAMPSLPYLASGGSSIVKAISCQGDCDSDTTFVIKNAVVLTVLDQIPANYGATLFRPAYVGTAKKIYSVADIRSERIPSFTPPSAAVPSLETLKATISNLQVDHFYHWGAALHPFESMPWYGADIANRNNDIAIRLALNDSYQDKLQLLVPFLQYGIDLAASLQETNIAWQPGGGHGYSRLLPLTLTALLFDDQTLAAKIKGSAHNAFGETGAISRSPITNEVVYGELVSSQSPEFDYWNAINWTTSFKTLPDPYLLIDGGANPGKGYQSCCSSGPLMGITIALKLYPGALAIPSNLDFIEYASRWIVSGALTQPDVCAPATGRCLNGSTLGAACNTANREIVCGSTSQCLIDMSGSGGYGITFGPDGNGYCILDADPSDGIGRFPQNNGISASTGSFYSTFQKNIMLAYWPTLSQ